MSRAANDIRCRGFSLAEAVVAMGVMSILLVGMGGAITMSVSAIDQGNDINADAVKAAEVADRFLADFSEATSLSHPDAGSIEFEVPDRDGDDVPETISYSWIDDGPRGAPLSRSVNGETPQVLMSNIKDFQLKLVMRAATGTLSAEQKLISFDTSLGATIKSSALTAGTPAAQYAKPAFASTVSSWSITRIRIRLNRDTVATGTLRISIVRNSSWTPTGEVLSTIDIPEAALPASAAWYDVALTAGPLLPSDGVFIKLADISGGNSGAVEYGMGGASMPYNTYFTVGSGGGATWGAPQDTSDMRFELYGITTTH